jgi:hypothetical protein
MALNKPRIKQPALEETPKKFGFDPWLFRGIRGKAFRDLTTDATEQASDQTTALSGTPK